MSDRPSNTTNNPRNSSDAWHTPETPGGWRVPSPEESGSWRSPEPQETGSWRVPALPSDMDIVPDDNGTWHLPRPEDTSFKPDDELVITSPAESGGVEVASALPFDDTPRVTRRGAAVVTPAEEQPLPFGPASGRSASQRSTTTPDLVYTDDEDDDSFSMSELIALASLVDEQSKTDAAPAVVEPKAADPNDPAEYARQQLAKLDSSQSAVAAPKIEPAPVVEIAPKLSPLAQKYRDTENNVRQLRQQYHAGKMTREQLQADLRKHMVLDDNNVWWMLGVETDTWYKYEGGQWAAATPPALRTAETPQDMGVSLAAAFEDGQTVPTSTINVEDDYMPLPRAVPVRDPDFTLPGTAGVYLPPVPTDLSVTQPMGASSAGDMTVASSPMSALSGATVRGPAFGAAGQANYAGVPSPIEDASQAPSYDLQKPTPMYDQLARRKKQSSTRTILIIALVAVALLFLLGACGVGAGLFYYSSLASPYQDEIAVLANYQPQFQTARILDAEGNVIVELTSRSGGARQKVALRDISPFLIHAVVATENERYFDDPGWDAIAIARAFLQNAVAGDITSGASTITQQIARNLILQDTTVSAERKLQEVVIASEIAQRYDKNFILEIYLNEFFFGNRSYGVEAASQFYFNKSAADLNLAEAALLAGMLQAPATYDPVVNSQAAFQRMTTVLELMRRVGCVQFQHEPYLGEPFCITDQQIRLGSDGSIIGGQALVEKAHVETTQFRPREYTINYPHFVNFIQAQVEQAFGPDEMYRRGFTIRTTLIPRLQDTAQSALAQGIAGAANTGLNTGAVLVADPSTGAIRAMVGSPDFNNDAIDGQVNNVLTWQQPGSSIKPIVYAAALEGVDRGGGLQYWTPASVIWDVPTTYQPNYTPVNYDRRYHGPIALRYALQNSYNVPAVKAFEFIGIDKFREVATRLGLRFLDDATFGLPSALGSNEVRLYDHVQAYATLANGGQRVPLYAITSITDADGNEVALPERPEAVSAVSPQVAFLMQNMLSDNQARADAFGLSSGLAIPGYDGLVAAKTGTTNEARDLWTMGFTRNLVVGVWTGTIANTETNATTSTAAIPIWNAVMRAALEGNPPQQFADPGGVVAVQVCGETGTVFDPNQTCLTPRTELFLQNQPPPPSTQAFVQQAAVDTWTGLRANQYCTENVEMRTFVNVTDPSAVSWLQSPDGAVFAQALGLPAGVQAAPPQECSPNTQLPNIRITTPGEGQQVLGEVQVSGAVLGPNFNRYQLEVASINAPDQWTIVHGPLTNQQQPGAVIGTWNTTQVPNGVYRLRLAAFANDGGYVFKTVQIGVNNLTPTTVPIPVVTEIPLVIPTTDPALTAAPLPFDIQIITPGPTPEVPGI